MTRVRLLHTIAISLMVLGLVAGGVCWALGGAIFFVMIGVSAALIAVGIVFATWATNLEAREKQKGGR
jgi:hypothetical protein